MLAENLQLVQQQLQKALAKRRQKNLLTGSDVILVAVTKNHPPEVISDILALGVKILVKTECRRLSTSRKRLVSRACGI